MAAPYYVAHTASANSLEFSVAAPAGVQAGDLELLLVETANETVATPSGWTIAPGSPQGTGTAGALTATRLSVFYRISSGAADSVTIADAGNHMAVVRVAFRGVNVADPFIAYATAVVGTATQSISMPQVTSDVGDTLFLFCMACGVDSDALAISSAWTNPGGSLTSFGELLKYASSLGNGGGVAIVSGVGTGASGTANATIGTSLLTSYVFGYITLALRGYADLVTIDVNPAGGGDYTSLQSAYDAEKCDLIAANIALQFLCAAGNVGKLATDGACVTGPYNKLIISAATPHVGYVDGDCSYADNGGSTAPVLNLAYTQYALVSRMLIGAALSSVGIQCATDGLGTVIEGCIIKFGTGMSPGGNSGYIGVTGIFEIRGSYVYGFFGYGLRCDGACIIRSVTVRYCQNGVRGNIGNTLVQNVLVQGASTCFSGTFDAASDYNMSNDASAPGAHSLTAQSATFADERTLDSRLLDSSAGVYAGAEALAADRDVLGTYLTALADAPCIGCAFTPLTPDPGGGDWWGGGYGVPKFGIAKYKHDYPAFGSGVMI